MVESGSAVSRSEVGSAAESGLPHPHKAVVFLVDDDEDLLATLTLLLEMERYIVLTARNGKEALHRMKNFTGPSVALIDLLMPDMNGWQLIDEMKRDKNLKSIPVVVCSAYPRVPVLGAESFLTKPMDLSELTHALREALKTL